MTSLKEWIDVKIEDKDINYFEYNNFSNIETIGKGLFGTAKRAYWNDGGIIVVLKSHSSTIDEKEDLLKELKILRQVNIHPNINQFLGVTKDPVHNNYIIVLQYANQGNLIDYLKKKFLSLHWKDKIQMALDIACGLKYLHSRQIIHMDLHATNILVNNGVLMIADFGLSKQLSEIKSNSALLGASAYIDPQCFIKDNYKRNEKSDIYSLGVLFWVISSGRPPFSEVSSSFVINLKIVEGVREIPVKDTPLEYQQLYKNCWKEEPYQRPDIDEVHRILYLLKSQFNRDEHKATQNSLIETCIREKHTNYYEFNEFNDIEEIGSGSGGIVYKATWKQGEKYVALKPFNLDNGTIKEIIYEIKLHRKVGFNDKLIKLYGITKTDSGEYLLVTEYAEGGTLRNYLKENFPSLNWHDKYRLALQLSSAIEYLHEKEILADFGSNRIKNASQISFDTIPYNDPEGFDITKTSSDVNSPGREQIEKYKPNEKSNVYSVGVLFWELSSGKKPFTDKEYDLFLAMEIAQGLREGIVEGTPEEYSNLYTKCWDGDPEKRPTIQSVVTTLKSIASAFELEPVKNLSSKQQIVQQFKLNHGLFLDGHSIEPSKQAVFESGGLNISLYKGPPLIYTSINDRNSNTNLLSFNSDDNNIHYGLSEDLQPSDICINFPIAEITYNADYLSSSFSNFIGNDEALYESYGHLFAKKVLFGGKLFIDDFTSAPSKTIDSFKSLLTWTYNSAKYDKENPFSNLSTLNFFPKIRASHGEKLHTPEKLTNWMNNLYQKNLADIISYNNFTPISELRFSPLPSVYNEKQPGVANFKEKLSLKDWVGDSVYVNLTRWIKEFRLGLIISKHFELENSKKIAIDFINVPDIESSDKCYLEIMKPATSLEEFLISNNMHLDSSFIKRAMSYGDEDKSSLEIIKPKTNLEDSFIIAKGTVTSNDLKYEDYTHFIVKCERYKITLTKDDIKPSEQFTQAIGKALESMKPSTYLQDVFDEYGRFFPLSIVLGKSLKCILPNSFFSNTSEKIDLPTFESLKPHLDKLNISYLLTQKGDTIKKNDALNWFQNTDNDLEIIEFDNIILSHEILDAEQQRKIANILNPRDNFKIIMTGIDDLKDLDDNNTEHYKRINIEPSLEDENYEVFGSIITEDKLKLNDFFVTFGLYDFNGFSAMINKLPGVSKTESIDASVNIKECYLLWIIIGNPSKSSVFSQKNRDFQVNYFRKSITLQSDQLNYHIEIPFPLSESHTISFNAHSTNFELKSTIKLINWSDNSIDIGIIKSESNIVNTIPSGIDYNVQLNSSTNIEIAICTLSSDYKTFKADNRKEREYSLDLIGCSLTENSRGSTENYGAKQSNTAIEKTIDTTIALTAEVIPFTKFRPLINEIGNILNEIIDIAQAAEHNKRTCECLLQRVYAADLAVLEFNVQRNQQQFFNKKVFVCLQNLIAVITKIKRFVAEISQMKTLLKSNYNQAKNIEKTFKELCKEFDNCVRSIDLASFTTTIQNKIYPDEIEQLRVDQEELNNHLEQILKEVEDGVKEAVKEFGDEVGDDVKELCNEFSSMVLKINAMNTTMEKLQDEQTRNTKNENDKINKSYQSRIDKIFKVHQLKFSDYEETDKESRKNGHVTKWVYIKNKGIEFAFKYISEEDKDSIRNQVTILKELHNIQNIIKFYGLTTDENKWYLVTEWAEYGNLREFYTNPNNKSRFDLRLKLRMSLDIARGLNFLRTVEIVHRDIRAKNILITLNDTAKLANFKLSRSLDAVTSRQSQNLERIRYSAPELSERAPDFKYDHKCEVYSFGILLWEIAEEKTPYEGYKDIVSIIELVRSKKRETFSENSPMPENFKKLAINAVNPEPDFRPKVTTTFEVLNDCFFKSFEPSYASSSQEQNFAFPKFTPKHTSSVEKDTYAVSSDFESFKYMTLADAAKQHKMVNKSGKIIGDIKTAYKCFEEYAYNNQTSTSNQIKAKYYKAYYILRGLVRLDRSPKDKDEIVAKLFKEVADDETNEFPEAKLRYGDCLYNGRGVEQNLPEALKYFEKAAEDNFKVAMYNAGKLYHNGCNGRIKADKEKATHYMKLAIYHEYEPAIKFCMEHGIDIST